MEEDKLVGASGGEDGKGKRKRGLKDVDVDEEKEEEMYGEEGVEE